MLFFSFLSFVFSNTLKIGAGENFTWRYNTKGYFVIYNPQDFQIYLYDYSTKPFPIFTHRTYHMIHLTKSGYVTVFNPNNVSKTLYFMVAAYTTPCSSVDVILDPSVGHYIQFGYSRGAPSGNASISSYLRSCFFYLGPSNYTVYTYSSISRYYARLYINNEYYLTTSNVSAVTSATIQFVTDYMRSRSGYASALFVDEVQFDTDYQRNETKLTSNDVYCFDDQDECKLVSFTDQTPNGISMFSLSLVISATIILIVLLIWIFYCCGCCKCCCKCCTFTRSERTALIDDDEAYVPSSTQPVTMTDAPVYGSPPNDHENPEGNNQNNDGDDIEQFHFYGPNEYYNPTIPEVPVHDLREEDAEQPQSSIYSSQPETNPYA